MATTSSAIEKKLVEFISDCTHDPISFAQNAYLWGEGDLKGSDGPRKWQSEILDAIGKHLRNPETRYQPLKIAVASGRGIGKSGLIGIVCHWGMSTCVDAKIVVTANTDTQLRTKTWPEISKWFRNGINAHWFKTTATSIASVSSEHERTWRADAIPWSENNSEAFQGLHNLNRRIILIFDEGSGIVDKIYDVSEGSLTDENTEIIWLVFSNPTKNTGRFREFFGRLKHRWSTWQIDSRNVEGTNKQFFDEMVEDNGEDSDYVRVHVKGQFPRVGSMQFISGDIVEKAMRKEPEATLSDPFVLGVDVARFGDDQSILCPRRGRDAKSIPWEKYRGMDTMSLAARIMELDDQHKFDAIFVDGGGVGGGVVDRLRMLKRNVIEVQFGGKADRGTMTGDGAVVYSNKRTEMWGVMRDALRGGLAIPDDQELLTDLVGVQYGYVVREGRDAAQLEKKSDMKKRGLASPDLGDALALTYAYPVVPSDHTHQFETQGGSVHQVEYDPFSRDRVNPAASPREYDPFRR